MTEDRANALGMTAFLNAIVVGMCMSAGLWWTYLIAALSFLLWLIFLVMS